MLNFADATASNTHPFIGLRPFRSEDASFFFGREEQIAALLRLLRDHSLISVVGSSGSGKSSLVRAGLLPRLMADPTSPSWDWVELRPGETPIRSLAEALARPNVAAGSTVSDPLAESRADRIEIELRSSSFGIREALPYTPGRGRNRLLIVVDQFEEIYRFADLRAQRNSDPARASEQRDEATFFVRLLLTALEDDSFPGAIVLTMRSDFIGECARFHGLSEAVTRTQYLVPALTRDQRELAIRGPVEAAGATIEPALVQRILNDTNEDPDQLPVLQHAMMRCWRCAAGADPHAAPKLAVDHYNRIGGVEKALNQHGDEVLANLDGQDPATSGLKLQYVAKRVFQSLTEVDGQERVIRRPQRLGDLVKVIAADGASTEEVAAIEGAVARVVTHFADPACSFVRAPTEDRLTASAVVDIGHEALIRRWERLGGLDQESWVREERNDAEKYSNLITFAGLDALPRQQLREFARWWDERAPTTFWARRYSRGGEDRLPAAGDLLARSHREVARRRRDRLLLQVGGALAIALGILAVFGTTLYQARSAAERVAIERALVIATGGWNLLSRDGATQGALLAKSALTGNSDTGTDIIFRPESMVLAYESLQRLRERAIVTVGTGRIASAFKRVQGGDFELVTISRDTTGGSVPRRWDPAPTWAPEARQPTERPVLGDRTMGWFFLSANPKGDGLLASGMDGLRFTGTADPERWVSMSLAEPATASGPERPADQPMLGTFAPDADFVLTGGRKMTWKLWALTRDADGALTGKADKAPHEFKNVEPPQNFPFAGAISPGMRHIAIGIDRGAIGVFSGLGWTSEKILRVERASGGERPSGADRCDRLESGPAREIRTSLGPAKERPAQGRPARVDSGSDGPGSPARWIAFDPSDPGGNQMLSFFSDAHHLNVWNIETEAVVRLETCDDRLTLNNAAISPDGKYVAATVEGDARIYLWALPPRPDGPGGRQSPVVLQGNQRGGYFWNVGFDDRNHIVASSETGQVWLWETVSALSRDPPANPTVQPTTACGDEGSAAVRSGGGSYRETAIGSLKIPSGFTIVSCVIFGEFALLMPSEGRLLVYQRGYGDSPIAVFGEAGVRWRNVVVATERTEGGEQDWVVATSDSGEKRLWRLFRTPKALLGFLDRSLPIVVDARSPGSAEAVRASLSDTGRQILTGDFWSLVNGSTPRPSVASDKGADRRPE